MSIPPTPPEERKGYESLASEDAFRFESLYVNVTYNLCMMGACYADLYAGSKLSHGNRIARVTLPLPFCNCFGRCGLSCCLETVMPITDNAGAQIGLMRLAKDCSRGCWLPRVSVYFNESYLGEVKTQCHCPPCYKTVDTPGPKSNLASTILNFHKGCCCFCGPCYAPYRCLCSHRSIVESYYAIAQGEFQSFNVINV